MCGIFCSIINNEHYSSCSECKCSQELLLANTNLLKNRGPDVRSEINLQYPGWNLTLAGFVLWLQGPKPSEQPCTTNGSHLLFNGDIFGGSLLSEEILKEQGDTKPLCNILSRSHDVKACLDQVHGPYSIIFVHNNLLFFGRDHYGRRSLLIGIKNGQMVLSSISKRIENFTFYELPAIGIFCLDLTSTMFCTIKLIPWVMPESILRPSVENLERNLGIEIIICYNEKIPFIPTDRAVSGTIDYSSVKKDVFRELLNEDSWMVRTCKLESKLKNAVLKRVRTIPNDWRDCIGVLFSGGLDCTILASLAHKCLPQDTIIQLINVAFEKKIGDEYKTPDRITGQQSYQELQRLYPNRRWVFIEVNVTRDELNRECINHIGHLIHPLETVLDDGLGCALWFASRAQTDSAKVSSRILLVGMGADELFGGYTRHRMTLRRGGWSALQDELEKDWYNLPHRNLARDDRVTSDHGRQLRTPYLDEDVVDFVRKLMVWERCCPTEQFPPGVGDKLLLRLLAYKLGLQQAARFPKRALQFGSRIANSKENAKDISSRLIDLKM